MTDRREKDNGTPTRLADTVGRGTGPATDSAPGPTHRISPEERNKIVAYLQKQPYEQVYLFIAALSRPPVV